MVHLSETFPSTRRVNTPSIRKEPKKRMKATGIQAHLANKIGVILAT
jgi:hypothetical protein